MPYYTLDICVEKKVQNFFAFFFLVLCNITD